MAFVKYSNLHNPNEVLEKIVEYVKSRGYTVIDDIKDYRELSIVLYTVFGAATILMYICSVLHHALKNIVAKEVFKRITHAFTFVMIAKSFWLLLFINSLIMVS